MSFEPGLSGLSVRALVAPDEMAACVSLYESVFELGPGDGSLNTRLLVGISRNSGIVVGAFANEELIGFSFSFLARDKDDTLYQYSQIACVRGTWQGRGVGRALKLAQRDIALSAGIHQIRWTFDPFQVKNAHFNLDVLGARCKELVRDLYGEHGHGLDAQHSTNRLVANWSLDAPHVVGLGSRDSHAEARDLGELLPASGITRLDDSTALLTIPSSFSRQLNEGDARRRDSSLSAMEQLFEEGFQAVSCRRVDHENARYTFVRGERS